MENPVDQQRLGEYQNRVSEWISKQGVLFQLRYAGSVGSYSIMKQLGSLFIRLIIVLAAAAGIGYFLLNRHFSSESYGTKIKEEVRLALDAKTIEASGFSRSRGTGGFGDATLEGGERSFFFNASFDGLNAPFEFLTGVTKDWKPDSLRLASADFELKSGGDDGEMDEAFSGIIETMDGKSIQSVDISQASFDWGYSKLTYGRIEDANFQSRLVDGKWEISLSGGTFRQNWVQGFKIKSGELVVDEDGIQVDELILEVGGGTLELSGSIDGPVSKPQFNLKGPFTNLPIEKLIKIGGIQVSDYLSGSISGNLHITGSTDQKIKMNGDVELGEGDTITIREKWAVLKGISLIDLNRTYRRVDFESGSFSFETYNGGLTLSKIDLTGGELALLKGDLIARLPSQQEAAERLGITLTNGFSGTGFQLDATDSSAAQAMEDERMSLRSATGGGSRVDDLKLDESGIAELANQDGFKGESLDQKRLRQEMNVHIISGLLKLGVPAVAFADNEKLAALHPADRAGWRWIDLKFEGEETFTTLTRMAQKKLLSEAIERKFGRIEEDGE